MGRKKKYNPVKSALSLARSSLKNVGVWHSVREKGGSYAQLINYKNGKEVAITSSLANMITNIRHNWIIHMMAIGHDGTRSYFKSEVAIPDRPMLQANLSSFLDKKHREFVKTEFNSKHLTNVAWIAIPNGVELNEKEIAFVIDQKKAW